MVRKDLVDEVIFEQKSERNEKGNHANVKENILGEGNSKCISPEIGACQHAQRTVRRLVWLELT